MRRDYLEKCVQELSAMIATFQQAAVLGGRTKKEGKACELLKDARLAIIEALEEQGDASWKSGTCIECERYSSQLSPNGYCESCIMQAAIEQEGL